MKKKPSTVYQVEIVKPEKPNPLHLKYKFLDGYLHLKLRQENSKHFSIIGYVTSNELKSILGEWEWKNFLKGKRIFTIKPKD